MQSLKGKTWIADGRCRGGKLLDPLLFQFFPFLDLFWDVIDLTLDLGDLAVHFLLRSDCQIELLC